MRFFSKLLVLLAWLIETVGGLFYPLLLIFSALFVNTNENNRLVDIQGFPFVLAAIAVGVLLMPAGLILFHKKKRKLSYILTITAALFFVAGACGIYACCIPASGATSLTVSGEYRLTSLELFLRHTTPIFIPALLWLSAVCFNKAEDKRLFEEALRDIKKGE